MIRSREDLKLANRIVIKAGTSIVSTPDGYPSLSRMATIVEHAARLVQQGKEVLIVTSGAVGVGRQRLSKQAILKQSMSDLLANRDPMTLSTMAISSSKGSYNSACAAAGQLGLMSLYETMFSQFDITVSQVLLTSFDFTSSERRRNIQHVLSQLLSLGIVPLLNENDAVSANQGYNTFGNTFSDNDSLASLVAVEMSAQLLILLTDVKGVYDRPPSEPNASIIDIFDPHSTEFIIGSKSLQGRGGMGAKVDAALSAVKNGVQACIIAAGSENDIIGKIIEGKEKSGTLFLHYHYLKTPTLSTQSSSSNLAAITSSNFGITTESSHDNEVVSDGSKVEFVEDLFATARQCREASSNHLSSCSLPIRRNILLKLSEKLISCQEKILEINQLDLEEAEKSGMSKQLIARLKLTPEKLENLSKGISQIADTEDAIDTKLGSWKMAENLYLDKISCPIGVILVIFESRPDCLPQIASLAIKSGNGLILKGGKEAQQTNQFLYSLVCDAITEASEGKIPTQVINLVHSREDVKTLLKMDEYIDLVIPRGSNELVKSIQSSTKITVLGHADGVCHLFIDESADVNKALRIIYDSKIDYPSACNSVETILFHVSHVNENRSDSHSQNGNLIEKTLRMLRSAGVSVFGGPRAHQLGFTDNVQQEMHVEYGDLKVTVEIVDSLDEAIQHINRYGSHHTDGIITENEENVKLFQRRIDSACVFHNASTRFADGYRFGLGAEVGISTTRIHARGPVGVEGLLSYKWILKSVAKEGSIVASNYRPASFISVDNKSDIGYKPIVYLHENLLSNK